ncbi:MAG: hypothetical protein F6K22_27435 [Okeania sp. SIO2F4]|uniref:hypothetical protein n=1 Tax=Okeania sp. SIO2F4 TaxID=2607790 RepID=UPI00142B1DEB|nr:hypothetical protein [Okeania sp. SIO2F4]NES06214.1 hypothetical protein [Okeania sp. SIO2F4]
MQRPYPYSCTGDSRIAPTPPQWENVEKFLRNGISEDDHNHKKLSVIQISIIDSQKITKLLNLLHQIFFLISVDGLDFLYPYT